jgi:hypothetical protein
VAYPLLAFASLDVLFAGLGVNVASRRVRMDGLGVSVVLLVVHVVAVWCLVRWDRLCVRREVVW